MALVSKDSLDRLFNELRSKSVFAQIGHGWLLHADLVVEMTIHDCELQSHCGRTSKPFTEVRLLLCMGPSEYS